MISKLPRWVWLGGCLLAFVGGMVNVVGLLSVAGLPVSHMSGNTCEISIGLAERDPRFLLKFALVVGSFFAGAVTSGAVIRGSTLQLGRRYSTALCLETALLCLAIDFLQKQSLFGVCLCAGACGLQNALASTFSGAIVRTTHVTGIITDLGIGLGQRLRGLPLEWRRVLLFLLLLGGFFSGGMTSALLIPRLGAFTLILPAILTSLLALAYEVYRMRRAEVVAPVNLTPPISR